MKAVHCKSAIPGWIPYCKFNSMHVSVRDNRSHNSRHGLMEHPMVNVLAALCPNGADDVRMIVLHVHVIWKKYLT